METSSNIMVKILFGMSIVLNIVFIGILLYFYFSNPPIELTPLGEGAPNEKELPLKKYSIENLRKTTFAPQNIAFEESVEVNSNVHSRLFTYTVEGKTVSGIAHFPSLRGEYPVIVMMRGYVDKEMFEPGVGTNPTARYLAQNGFITLAPDRLGYGSSDEPSSEPFADRFLAYPTYLQIIANLKNMNNSLDEVDESARVQEDFVGIWAHSNGGQIALSILEIIKDPIPTVLWAPVSKPFPYSVLYYTDEFNDEGKYLRFIISQFEHDYDVEDFSHTSYLSDIDSPLLLLQGGKDDAVPPVWSDELYQALVIFDSDITYVTYPASDHNMVPEWDQAAQATLSFLQKHLEQ